MTGIEQKKEQPCPGELEAMLTPAPPNYVHVVVGGNLVGTTAPPFKSVMSFR